MRMRDVFVVLIEQLRLGIIRCELPGCAVGARVKATRRCCASAGRCPARGFARHGSFLNRERWGSASRSPTPPSPATGWTSASISSVARRDGRAASDAAAAVSIAVIVGPPA